MKKKPVPIESTNANSTAAKPIVVGNFRAPAATPTQQGSQGIRFDFNDGCRIALPEGDWQVRLSDALTNNTLYETQIKAGVVASSKKYYVPFEIQIRSGDTEVLRHRFDCSDQNVLIQFPVGTLGDLIAWFPYAVKFGEQHRCRLT